MPAVARMEKKTVVGRATVTSWCNGMPSYGMRPPKDHQMKVVVISVPISHTKGAQSYQKQWLSNSHLEVERDGF